VDEIRDLAAITPKSPTKGELLRFQRGSGGSPKWCDTYPTGLAASD
jgi:hypothetical protein